MTIPETAFRQFHHQLSLFIAKRVQSRDDVQDILQEVFLRVVRNQSSLERANKPLAWLYTVTRSVLVDHYRKNGRSQRNAERLINQQVAPGTDEEFSPEFEKCLSPLIAMLPAKYHQAITFSQNEKGTQVEFARSQQIKLSTAKSRMQRGRKLLKQAILSCCRVEFDAGDRVMSLQPGSDCQDKCC